jgi:nitrite reductase/ring-hydroxylating ferredoxin subunit
MTRHPTESDCGACEVSPSRREFLREAALAAAGAFMALGAGPRDAVALPIARLVGSRAGGSGLVSYPIPTADGATIDTENEIIVARYQGLVYAFDLSCPHQHTALKWLAEDNRFQCPKHKSKYQPDGTFISGRATRNMDRHPVKLEGGKLVVDTELVIQSDKSLAAWQSASVKP